MVTPIVYTTFWRLKTETFENAADPILVWKVRGYIKRTKWRLLKTMAWLPTFAQRILDNRVNNNIILIIVPIDMYR